MANRYESFRRICRLAVMTNTWLEIIWLETFVEVWNSPELIFFFAYSASVIPKWLWILVINNFYWTMKQNSKCGYKILSILLYIHICLLRRMHLDSNCGRALKRAFIFIKSCVHEGLGGLQNLSKVLPTS